VAWGIVCGGGDGCGNSGECEESKGGWVECCAVVSVFCEWRESELSGERGEGGGGRGEGCERVDQWRVQPALQGPDGRAIMPG
jgi:hypothetical protein